MTKKPMARLTHPYSLWSYLITDIENLNCMYVLIPNLATYIKIQITVTNLVPSYTCSSIFTGKSGWNHYFWMDSRSRNAEHYINVWIITDTICAWQNLCASKWQGISKHYTEAVLRCIFYACQICWLILCLNQPFKKRVLCCAF